MSNAIKLRLINRSNDANNTEYVVFQKNVATSFEQLPVAWKVVKNLGVGDYHPFEYSFDIEVSANDSYGNYTFPQKAVNGQQFAMERTASGDQLQFKGNSSNPDEIDVLNNLTVGVIGANCFRSGLIVATKTSIVPGQKAVFEFKPTIFIGAISQLEEGDLMNSAIVSQINTEISLLGINSADIIISGGGSGAAATPFTFTLDNVVYA